MSLRPLEDGPARRSRRRWWPAGRNGAAPDAAEVYRALAPAVLGYVRSQRAAEPDDLLGEVFLQVVRDLPRFRGDAAALRRWVFTIAYHRLVDARRRSARQPAVDGSPLPERCSAPPADRLDPDLVRALGELTADQRDVVALRFVADLSIDAVATLTGRSPGAVKALQHRGLAALAEPSATPAARRSRPPPADQSTRTSSGTFPGHLVRFRYAADSRRGAAARTPPGRRRAWFCCSPGNTPMTAPPARGRNRATTPKIDHNGPYQSGCRLAHGGGTGGASSHSCHEAFLPTGTEDTMAEHELLTPGEVAVMFRVDPKTVTRWARAGRLSAIRTIGGHRRFRASEVQHFLENDQDIPA